MPEIWERSALCMVLIKTGGQIPVKLTENLWEALKGVPGKTGFSSESSSAPYWLLMSVDLRIFR